MVSQVQQMKPMFVSDPNEEAWFFQMLWEVRVELLMFASAMAGYLLLFANRVPKDVKRLKLKVKQMADDFPQVEEEAAPEASPRSAGDADAWLSRAVAKGDHRGVLKFWNAIKQFEYSPTVPLSQIVESMQKLKKDSPFITRELSIFFQKCPLQREMNIMNDLLESLSKRLDSALMDSIIEMLPALGLQKDERTYEIFLSMHATTRSYPEVRCLLSEMAEANVNLSTRASLAAIKAAMQNNNFDEAFRYFTQLKATWSSRAEPASPWAVPRHIMAQLAESACKAHQIENFIAQLKDLPVPEEAINAMLSESIRLDDSGLARSVETLARAQQSALPDSTYSLLIKGLAGRPWRMKAVVNEVLTRDPLEVSPDLAMTILSVCAKTSDTAIADTLLERANPRQLQVLVAFIRFYVETEQFEKACDVFEHRVIPSGEAENQRRLIMDPRVERSLMNAALQCGRHSLVSGLFDSNKTDVAKHIMMIRRCASESNLKGALSILNSLKEGGVPMNAIIYNTIIDACVKCHDLQAAEEWIKKTEEAGLLDVVSFNTLIKAHLHDGHLDKARNVMSDMKRAGFEPNRVTYNELINSVVALGRHRSEIWDILKEMKTAEIAPNQVTCSILLKNLNAKSTESDVLLTMDLIESLEEPMDEVLLSSMVEACVRIGKPDLLVNKLKLLESKARIAVTGSHTCGSLIKAYGHAKDIEGVWRCWKEMRSKLIKPTSITLGCMIEAVVNNGDAEGAYELLHQLQQDEQCRNAVNAVVYCSVLKGFSRERKLDRVWDVYQEMSEARMEMSLITFNTIIDACARAGQMEQLPKVMEDMKKNHVDPNLVTYSTILKGHCQAGDVQLGFSTLKMMKQDTNLKPDEIMYNSLLEGCAKNGLLEEGLQLCEEMQKEGVSPSNFTLSILVKLLSRAHQVDKAFDMVRDLSQQFRFKPNAFVYTNLIQACISSRQHNRAMGVLETMVNARVQPDGRTYAVLVRDCIYNDRCEQASKLMRAALGLPGALDLPGLKACRDFDPKFLNEALVMLADRGYSETLAAPLFADIKSAKLNLFIHQDTQRRVAMSSAAAIAAAHSVPRSSQKGKGKGSR